MTRNPKLYYNVFPGKRYEFMTFNMAGIIKKRRQNRPHDPSHRDRSCTGKKRYRSEADALAMIGIQQVYGEQMGEVHPYRCGFCGQWHLGHMTRE